MDIPGLTLELAQETRIALMDREQTLQKDLSHPDPVVRAITERQLTRVRACLECFNQGALT